MKDDINNINILCTRPDKRFRNMPEYGICLKMTGNLFSDALNISIILNFSALLDEYI